MLSNYSIKKIIPRLIIVAIAVNLSFYICAALVDVSNIIGANIVDLLGGIVNEDARKLGALMVVGLALAMLIVIAVVGVVGVLSAVLIIIMLVLRDVVLTALIIVSPIAFVLYLLPNTEKWFKKWLTEFTRMLFVYPMIAGVWGVCLFMIDIINSASDSGFVGYITKILLLLAPAAAIMPVMKTSGQLMGNIQGMVNKASETTGVTGFAKNMDKAKRANINAIRTRKFDDIAKNGNINNYELQKDEYGNETGKYVNKLTGKTASNRMTEALKGGAESMDKYKNLAGIAGFLGNVGHGDILKRAETRDKLADEGRSGTARTGEIELDPKLNMGKLQNELRKQQAEYKLNVNPSIVNLKGALKASKAESEAGTKSPEWLALQAAQKAAPQNARITADVEAYRDKMLKDAQVQTQNAMTMNATTGKMDKKAFSAKDLMSGVPTQMSGSDGNLKDVSLEKFLNGDYTREGSKDKDAMIEKQIMAQIGTAIQNSSSVADGTTYEAAQLKVEGVENIHTLLSQIKERADSGTISISGDAVSGMQKAADQKARSTWAHSRGNPTS